MYYQFTLDFFKTQDPLRIPDSGVDEDILRHIAEKFSAVPEEITVHPSKSDMLDFIGYCCIFVHI